MSDLLFWLRMVQSVCSAATALSRDFTLHSLRAQAEVLLVSAADAAALYPERAGEMWRDTTLAAEQVSAQRFCMDEVVENPRPGGMLFEEAARRAKDVCGRAYKRFCTMLDESVRGRREWGMSPSVIDLSASLCRYGADGAEPSAEDGIAHVMSGAEVLRGMIDPARPDDIMRCNAYCVLCDKVRLKTFVRADALKEGESLMSDLTAAGIKGDTLGFPPILTDALARLHARLLRKTEK